MIALVGNPNTGKSTLFNALTSGARAKVSNLTGTTVDVLGGEMALGDQRVELLDIPGTYSLAGRSPEEWVAVRAMLGLDGQERPAGLVLLADAVRLERSLYLALQILELGVPLVIAVNLLDEARAQGLTVDVAAVARDLGVPVVGISARTGEGLDALREAVAALVADPSAHTPGPRHAWSPDLTTLLGEVQALLPAPLQAHGPGFAGIVVLSLDDAEARPAEALDVPAIRAACARHDDPVVELVQTRYRWLDAHAPNWRQSPVSDAHTLSDRVDAVVLHPVSGTLLFLGVMTLVFTALFAWADPAIGLIEDAFGFVGEQVGALFGEAPSPALAIVRDFVVDGLIGGVGSILVFLPQIALLFFFIGLLEDSGYLARAAHLVDRVLRLAGLPGRAFVPLLSGYACAVPAIMATRAMPRFRDRLLTMLVIPLTTCSARLPVYTLIIAALFPATIQGFPLPVQPLVLLAMYVFSTFVTILASIVLGRLALPATESAELIELVPYRLPSLKVVLGSTWRNAKHFVEEAGGVILVATVVLWAMLYFPRVDGHDLLTPEIVAQAEASGLNVDEVANGLALEQSIGGRIGKTIEPVIAPLGFDWRMGIGIIGAFAAREVFVSTMGLVYGIEDADEENEALRAQIADQRRPDGTKVWTPLVGLSLMVFFALAMQCTSTLAVLVKESRGFVWPAFVFTYMTALAWTSSFLVFQVGRLLGFG
ncbi:MAG: ferrous iron transport protein B [Alphaproteobacteria bacterium]|nr:ferrous iron transport protein B [Alphaproteobacteria bacterium]